MSLSPIYKRAYAIKGSYLDKNKKEVRESWRVVYASNINAAKKLYKDFLTKKLHYTKVKIIDIRQN